MKRGWLGGLLAGACLLSYQDALSMEQVFKFSDPAQASQWRITSQKLGQPSLVKRFGLYSDYSFRFSSPTWRGNLPQWPSCEGKPDYHDWRGFDRLVIDLTNPGAGNQRLWFFVSDSKVPFRKGFRGGCSVASGESKRFVFKLNRWPKHVNRADVSVMHLFTERPGADMDVFVNGICLLKPGEAEPGYPLSFVNELREMYKPKFEAGMKAMLTVADSLKKYAVAPALESYLNQIRKDIADTMSNGRQLLGKASITMPELQSMQRLLANSENRYQRYGSDLALLKAALDAGQDISQMAVGIASTMTKVMPRDVGFKVDAATSVEVSLARNEREGTQVVVMGTMKDLSGVTVTLSPLKNAQGAELSCDVDVVGFVETKERPPYGVKYVGWWPDPILRGVRKGAEASLDQCGSVSVKRGDSQAFWLRFKAAKTQAPGLYTGTATVSAKGVKPVVLPVSAKVYSFAMPDHMSLPTAMSFSFPQSLIKRKKQPIAKMKIAYADFLADYMVNWDNLYRPGEPDWEVVKHLHKQGRLTAFNLGNVFNVGVSKEHFDEQLKNTLDRLRIAYDKAKALGLLEYAYIYGFDERGKDQFPLLERCAQALRKNFPEVLLMTTSYDHSFGLNSVVKSMQAWCPLTPKFDVKKAEAARKSGRWVWWYICCGPLNPYANWLVEYDAIESRLLMGAQTAKYRPDGFLYYAMTIWNQNTGVDCAKGPFTTWNPVSWTVYHGDGSLMYCDKDGYPLPSIRLENYRDGLEDYAYACILEEAIRQMKAKASLTAAEQVWLKEAAAALVVPESVVVDMKEYTRDPKLVLAWRARMAEAIEKSGLKNLNPWGKHFGVRGF